MKAIFFALFFVVFTSAQVITFSNYFAPTYEGKTTTNLIRVKNNGKFFQSGRNLVQNIKFRISIESSKPKSASASFNPVDDKFFGAIVGEAEGFFYFNVNGLNGTYQCELHMKYNDWKGNQVKATPYKFAFTILKKQSRDVVGRVRPVEEETEIIFEEGKMVIENSEESVTEERDVQTRQSSNPDCPTPSSNEALWDKCTVACVSGQSTSNNFGFKNQLPSGAYSSMVNISYYISSYSPGFSYLINSGPTTAARNSFYTVNFNITSGNAYCITYFTWNMKYLRATVSGGSVNYQPGGTWYTWSTTFNPVTTYPPTGAACTAPPP